MKKLKLVFAFVIVLFCVAACEEQIELKEEQNIQEECCIEEEPLKD